MFRFLACFGMRLPSPPAPQSLDTRDVQDGPSCGQRAVRTSHPAALELVHKAQTPMQPPSPTSQSPASLPAVGQLLSKDALLVTKDADSSSRRSECDSSTMASVPGAMGCADTHAEHAAEVQALTERLQASEAQAAQACAENARLQCQVANLQIDLAFKKNEARWYAEAEALTNRVLQDRSLFCVELQRQLQALDKKCASLQQQCRQLEVSKCQSLADHCAELREVVKLLDASEAAEQEADRKWDEAWAHIAVMVPALKRLAEERVALHVSNEELKSQLRSCVDDNLTSLDIVHTLSGRVDQANAHIEALEHANQGLYQQLHRASMELGCTKRELYLSQDEVQQERARTLHLQKHTHLYQQAADQDTCSKRNVVRDQYEKRA